MEHRDSETGEIFENGEEVIFRWHGNIHRGIILGFTPKCIKICKYCVFPTREVHKAYEIRVNTVNVKKIKRLLTNI